VPPPWLLALALIVALLVLIPTRRLRAADVAPRWVAAYAIGLWLVAMALAIRPIAGRVLVPFVLIAYLAPFIATPDVVGRVLRRGRIGGRRDGRPPMKNVTPPDAPSTPDATPDESPADGR
jgi:hypothetical protein